jgi:hypothetical protein
MASENVNLYLEQNSDFYQSFSLTDFYGDSINAIPYSFKAQIRSLPDDTILGQFDIDKTNAIKGVLTLFIPASETLLIPVNDEYTPYRYDLMMYDVDGNQYIIFHGEVFVLDSITRK